MASADIKLELIKLIEQEPDMDVIQAMFTILKKVSPDQELKQKLTARALKAEEDIEAGRVYIREELEKEMRVDK